MFGGNVVREVEAGGRLAADSRRTGWRADGSTCVGICEKHAVLCQLVCVWRVDRVETVAIQVVETEVVDHNHDNVGPLGTIRALRAVRGGDIEYG